MLFLLWSPDPVRTSIQIAQTVQGIQSSGIIACAKHFVDSEQEHFRQETEASGYGYNISASVSSNIDDVTIHELYMWPFADAVRAGVGAVMCSYNQVNNNYACQNSYILNQLHSGISGALAGLDITVIQLREFILGRQSDNCCSHGDWMTWRPG